MKRFYAFAVILAVAVASTFAWFHQKNSRSHSVPNKEAVLKAVETLPRGFVPNQGQWNEEALFSAPGFFGNTWITKNGELRHVILAKQECKKEEKHKPCPTKALVLSESFVGGSAKEVKGEKELFTKVSYFIGNDKSKHKAGLPSYEMVSLGEVWKGIEVKLKAKQNSVEKIFVVKPGANPEEIKISLKGAKGIEVKDSGELVVKTGYGDVEFSKPVAWQEEGNEKKPVKVSYKLDKTNNTYAFAVEGYDKNKPLYIDPLLASTLLGGSGSDYANALAIDSSGNVYVAGYTYSTDFPTTSRAYDTSHNGGEYDIFISKLDSNLTTLLASTFLGGSKWDRANALAIDSSGNVYVAGWTGSENFPTTSRAYDTSHNYNTDAFISKFDANLTTLLASTFLGGSGGDEANALAIDSSGNVYVAGETNSQDFPTTIGAYDTSHSYSNSSEAFISKLNSDLSTLLASRYLGGRERDTATALAIDSSGNVYVAGETFSDDFPITPRAYDTSYNGGPYDVFISKLNSNLQLLASTYLGGSRNDITNALAIDSSGNVYVAGWTESKDFPTTTGAYDRNCGTDGNCNYNAPFIYSDTFISKFDANLSNLLASTYLGGSSYDYTNALAIDSSGNVYVAGWTESRDFPTTTGAYDTSFNGDYDDDVFISKLNSNLSTLLASTYLGGSGGDEATAIAIDSSGNVYVAGETFSPDFPITPRAYDTTPNVGYNAYISKLDSNLSSNTLANYTLTINPKPTGGNITTNPSGINCGTGNICSATFTSGSSVTLSATASSGYTFGGWGGDCASCGTNATCTINMNANKTCSATFNLSSNGGGGSGSVNIGSGSGNSSSAGCSMVAGASPANLLIWLLVPTLILLRRTFRN